MVVNNDRHLAVRVNSITNILTQDVLRKPNDLVFSFVANDGVNEELMTYSQLEDSVTKIANVLNKIKTNEIKQDKAILILPPGKDFVAAFYACILTGVIAVPSFPPKNELHLERLKLALDDLDAPIILGDKSSLEILSNSRDLKSNKDRWIPIDECASESPSKFSHFITEADSIAMLQYSSGSTGKPKGVIISNRNLVENSQLIKDCFGHQEGKSRSVIWLPPYHDMGMVGGIIQGVYSSYPTMLMPTNVFLRRQVRWLECISKFKATSSGGPNFAFELCIKNIKKESIKNLDLSSWKVAFCGAEPIRYETMINFSEKFKDCGFNPEALYPCYGMAETTLMATGKPFNRAMNSLTVNSSSLSKNIVQPQAQNNPQKNNDSRTLVSSGVPHSSLDIRIVDPMLQISINEGEVGEIWVSGPSVAQGYWNDSVKTQHAFCKKLPEIDGDYFRTGDLGFMLNGELYVTGRIKEVIIIRGENFYPQDIEFEIAKICVGLKNCRFVAFSSESEEGEILIAAIEVPKTEANLEEIKKKVNETLIDKFGIKASVVLFIPRKTIKVTSSGKLQRTDIKQKFSKNTLAIYQSFKEYESYSENKDFEEAEQKNIVFNHNNYDDILLWLKSVIASKLNISIETVLGSDRFSSLGLDSITAVDILFELEEQHGVSVFPETLYECNTPELLAMKIFEFSNTIKEKA